MFISYVMSHIINQKANESYYIFVSNKSIFSTFFTVKAGSLNNLQTHVNILTLVFLPNYRNNPQTFSGRYKYMFKQFCCSQRSTSSTLNTVRSNLPNFLQISLGWKTLYLILSGKIRIVQSTWLKNKNKQNLPSKLHDGI